ncbi:MAG: PleD family two-component system response regulator [Bdellovibrionales bacterium]
MSARILIVDDNPLNIKLLAARLSREYYVVETVTDGFQALDAVRKNIPDIILLDVMMPGMDGFEVCRKLKEEAVTRHIPVVMVTALTDVSDRVQGLLAGADDFLSKPINEVALLARVRSLLRLKFMMDEWRLRERSAAQYGAAASKADEERNNIAGAKLLYVGDDQVEHNRMAQALDIENISLAHVRNNEDAVAHLKAHPCEAVLVAMRVGDESAMHLIAEVRSAEQTRQMPVVMVADDVDIIRVAKALELGATDYILRPVDGNELLARMRTQIRQTRTYLRLRENYERSLAMALTDPLTGAYNRRYLDIHLPRLFERARQSSRPLSVIMLDIDHFKKINDTYGHPAGDAVLVELVTRLNKNLRSFDLVTRMGGEEFAIVMPETDLETAEMVAERLRKATANDAFRLDKLSLDLPVTISIGISALQAANDGQPQQIVKRADDALYRAKNAGRNCIEIEN